MKLLLHLLLLALGLTNVAHADLVIYIDRPVERFVHAADLFTQKTGEKVIFIPGTYAELAKRIELEGANGLGDAIVTKDLIYLTELTANGRLQPMLATPAVSGVQEFMRDPALNWVALTYRVRTAIRAENLDSSELTTYEDLADGKWQGRLCLRSGKAAYNQALVSHLIVNHGESRAREIVDGWVKNLAVDPLDDDLAVIDAIVKGECEVGIINHYYLAGELAKPGKANLPVKIAFLNQTDKGVHTNGVGIGILKTSTKAALAQEFIDILLSPEIQLEISSAHKDYPAVLSVQPSTLIKDWGPFKASPINWSEIGAQTTKARAIISDVGYL